MAIPRRNDFLIQPLADEDQSGGGGSPMGPFDPFSTDFFDSGIGGTIGGTFGDFDFQLDPNAPSNFEFNTGQDVIENFFTPQLNDILDQSKFTFEQIQELLLNPTNLKDNAAFQSGLEGLQTPIELDFRSILAASGQQSSAKNNLLALSRALAGGGVLEPGAEFGQINDILSNQTAFEDLSLFDPFQQALAGGPDVEGNRFLNALFDAGTEATGGGDNPALDKLLELIDDIPDLEDDPAALDLLLQMIQSGPDFAGVQTAVEGVTQSTVDRLFGAGGAVEQGLSTALRQNIRTGFGTTTGQTDATRLLLGEAASEEVARTVAEKTGEFAITPFASSVSALAQVASSPNQDPFASRIDALSRASAAISGANAGAAGLDALSRGAEISLGTQTNIFNTRVGALSGALSDEANFVLSNQNQALGALQNLAKIRADLDTAEAQLAAQTALGADSTETQLNIAKLNGSLRAAESEATLNFERFRSMFEGGLNQFQIEAGQRQGDLNTLTDFQIAQGQLGEQIGSDIINVDLFGQGLDFSREQFEEAKRQWDQAMILADGDCNLAKSLLTSTATGAAAGSLFPGPGTLIGAGVGFVAGLFGGGC